MTDCPDIQQSLAGIIHTAIDTLKAAQGNEQALTAAVITFYQDATSIGLSLDQIEDALGVNENCIMDLAALPETDEEVVIAAFEEISQS